MRACLSWRAQGLASGGNTILENYTVALVTETKNKKCFSRSKIRTLRFKGGNTL